MPFSAQCENQPHGKLRTAIVEANGFVYQRRKLWNEKSSGPTTMVNDVAWMPDEELKEDEEFVPEN